MKSIYGDHELIDIGHGVGISFWHRWPREQHPEPAGLMEEHRDARDPSKRCAGSIRFKGRGEGPTEKAWEIVTWEPLTLSPSLLCTACGHHGWIRDGKWVPA
jgi:hypothetical protein